MATWQAKLLAGSYKLVSGDPPADLNASEFWSVATDLIPQDVPILLGGSHRRLAPYLNTNIVSALFCWSILRHSLFLECIQNNMAPHHNKVCIRNWSPRTQGTCQAHSCFLRKVGFLNACYCIACC